MTLPRKVREQLEAADATLAQMNAPEPSAAPAPEPAPEPAAAEPAPQAAPAPTPAPAPDNDEYARLLQQHRSLQGVHRSMEDRIRQQATENQQLAQRLDQLERERAATPATPPVEHRDSEVFGDDLVKMVHRQAGALAAGAVQSLQERLAHLENRIQGTNQAVAQTAEEVFVSRLKDAVPDYAEINATPGFLQWLAEEDNVYGLPRQKALDNASQRLDVGRTAKIFLAYKALHAPAAAPAAPVGKSATESRLEREIAPNTAAAPAPTAQTHASYLLTKDVETFYRELGAGKYRGREELAAQIEQTINNALQAGRIFDRPPRQPV